MTSPSPSKTVHQLLGAQAGRQGLTSSCRHASLVQATTKVCTPLLFPLSSPLLPAVSGIARLNSESFSLAELPSSAPPVSPALLKQPVLWPLLARGRRHQLPTVHVHLRC